MDNVLFPQAMFIKIIFIMLVFVSLFYYAKAKDSKKSKRNSSFNSSKPTLESQCGTFECPSCQSEIRIMLPLKGAQYRCRKCSTKFKVAFRDDYIYITEMEKQRTIEPQSIEDCFNILGIDSSATLGQINKAYRTKMREYHPDKVRSLGKKIRILAEKEAKAINAAYSKLKETREREA